MPDRLTGETLVIATGHALSLALLADGEVLAEAGMEIDRGHAEALVPAIARLLLPFGGAAYRGDQIVVEIGPGSFTGLRIGIAAAKALGLVWGVAVEGVRSTQLVAAEARLEGLMDPLLVALAAPRGQIWVERFACDGLVSLLSPQAVSLAEARGIVQTGDHIVGSAATLLGSAAAADAPRAASLRGVAGRMLMEAEPLYVRAGEWDANQPV